MKKLALTTLITFVSLAHAEFRTEDVGKQAPLNKYMATVAQAELDRAIKAGLDRCFINVSSYGSRELLTQTQATRETFKDTYGDVYAKTGIQPHTNLFSMLYLYTYDSARAHENVLKRKNARYKILSKTEFEISYDDATLSYTDALANNQEVAGLEVTHKFEYNSKGIAVWKSSKVDAINRTESASAIPQMRCRSEETYRFRHKEFQSGTFEDLNLSAAQKPTSKSVDKEPFLPRIKKIEGQSTQPAAAQGFR